MTTAPAPRGGLDVLIVDDSRVDGELLPLLLLDRGIQAGFRHAWHAASMREALLQRAPDLILSDVNMPGFGGVQAHGLHRELAPDARFCFLSDSLDGLPDLPQADGLLRKDAISALVANIDDWFGERARTTASLAD